jgi:hypothetical protein
LNPFCLSLVGLFPANKQMSGGPVPGQSPCDTEKTAKLSFGPTEETKEARKLTYFVAKKHFSLAVSRLVING